MGLKDDNINLQINIGVSGAAANIQRLSDENMKLASSTKAAKTRMAELKAQGEKNSEEYKQLEATIKANTTAINENKKKIEEHEKSLSLNEKTMVQLRKEAKELQAQLDRTVESADPKGYADLQKQLETVKEDVWGNYVVLDNLFQPSYKIFPVRQVPLPRVLWGFIKHSLLYLRIR